MRHKLVFLLLILAVFSNLLTGCRVAHEMNELTIATAIGIDKKQNEYLVTVQVLNPKEIASQTRTTRATVATYDSKGATVFEAFRKLTMETPSKVYLSHVRMIILSKELAKEGINGTLDFLVRDPDIRGDSLVVVAQNTTPDMALRIFTFLEDVPANKVFTSVYNAESEWSATTAVNVDKLITTLMSEGDNPVLQGIVIEGYPEAGQQTTVQESAHPPATLNCGDLAAFKKDKLIGWLNEEQAIGYNFIKNHVHSTIVNVFYTKECKVAIEVIQSKTTVKGMVENGKPGINIKVMVVGNLGETDGKIDLMNPDVLAELEKKTGDKIQTSIEATIQKAKKDLRCDIFGFGEVIHRADYEAWKKLKNNWDEEFISTPVNVKVTARLFGTGSTATPFFMKSEE